MHDISISLESGRDLAASMSDHPTVFNMFYISMVRIGETTGQLDAIFLQLAHYLERDKKTRKQIKSAVRYPTFVVTAIGIAMVIINLFVIPVFANMFAKYDAQLPLVTRVLLGVSEFSVAYWPYILVGMVGAGYGFYHYIQTEKGRYLWDKKKLALPVVGKLIYRATLARFARLFSMALNAGVPLITALTVVARALDNVFVEDRVLGMQGGIERGESISRTAAASGMFDSLVMQMMGVGEETGSMEELLHEVAEYYDSEVEYDIEKLSASIEPILTVCIGVIVLILALGVFLPMWNLGGVILHKNG
jgi:MSHA biogenesis protein MshG